MDIRELKRKWKRVDTALLRTDIFGNIWLTVYMGNVTDCIRVDDDNMVEVNELVKKLEKRNECKTKSK